MSIEDAIRAAEESAQRLREALGVLDETTTREVGYRMLAVGTLRERAAGLSLDGVRRGLAEARRPNGPMVTLERSRGGRDPIAVELVRRTATQVIVAEGGRESSDRYKVESGYPATRGDRFFGCWCIRDSDLAKVRAMPVGENAVSKALKAIEAGRYAEERR